MIIKMVFLVLKFKIAIKNANENFSQQLIVTLINMFQNNNNYNNKYPVIKIQTQN